MDAFKKYLQYLKDNPEGYWFKRNLYGVGWIPAKWQGWLAVITFVLLLAWIGSERAKDQDLTEADTLWLVGAIVLAVGAFIFLCYQTGEKLGWQWGIKDHYVCLGGCKGVSKTPGVCQTLGCAKYGQALSKCGCTDKTHNNFRGQ